jgi:hypothetical protein
VNIGAGSPRGLNDLGGGAIDDFVIVAFHSNSDPLGSQANTPQSQLWATNPTRAVTIFPFQEIIRVEVSWKAVKSGMARMRQNGSCQKRLHLMKANHNDERSCVSDPSKRASLCSLLGALT